MNKQRDGRIENHRLMDGEKKLQKTTLLRSEEASEPLESNVCGWLDVESSLFFALICAGFDLGILSNRNQPSSLQKTQSMVGAQSV